MNANKPDPFSAAVRRLDDAQLESLRHWMLSAGDRRYEEVVEELLVRGVNLIEAVVVRLCQLQGIGSAQIKSAVIEASLRLQMRLCREERLPGIETLADRFARQAVEALDPPPAQPPRLASRKPELRSVEGRLGDALRDGRIRRRGGGNS